MTLLPYQQEIHDKVVSMPQCALFLEMGFGKTAIMLNVIQTLKSQQNMRFLVIAPPHVAALVWNNECSLFTPTLSHFSILSGMTIPKRSGVIEKNEQDPADFCILSTTLVDWFFSNRHHKNYQGLIIDESTKFKSPKSKGFKAISRDLDNFKHRYILTGTPIPNGYEDLWSQIYILDKGQRLGYNITSYRNKYFTRHAFNMFQYYLLPGAEEDIKHRISDITLARSLSNTDIKLPPYVSEVQYTDMPSSLLKDYNKLKKEFILEYRKTPLEYKSDPINNTITIVAPTQAALTNKLLQYCSGAVYFRNQEYITLHTLKIELFQEVLYNFPNQRILLAYNYNHEAERLLAALPSEVIKYDSNPDTLRSWEQGSTPRTLMAHPQSIAHGLNLQTSCSIIVWFGFTWNLELYQQFNKRIHRRGQEHTTYCIHLAVGNIEYKLMDRLKAKDITQKTLMKYMEMISKITTSDSFLC